MKLSLRLILITACLVCVLSTSALAQGVAVVDTVRILTDSTPAQKGEEHLKKVQGVLQKGMQDLEKNWKGKEKSAEAQQSMREGLMALEQQLSIERQAVLKLLGQALEKSVKEWRTANSTYTVVINRQAVLDSAPAVDVTAAVLVIMNKQEITFPKLPTVTVNAPKEKGTNPKKK